MHKVAEGFGVTGIDTSDSPYNINYALKDVFQEPLLLNINTVRKYWHAGAGIDDPNVYDRYEDEMLILGDETKVIHEKNKKLVKELWQRQLEKQ
jgi:hypothetical protein